MYSELIKGDKFDVIIVGGSFAGLAAAMALGRSMRRVLVIDAGQPCNHTAPQAHNLITHDGRSPKKIADLAKDDVRKYTTVRFLDGFVQRIDKTDDGFAVSIAKSTTYTSAKIILATGVKDVLPKITGFPECWGISVIHCPYCHGFEYRAQPTAILANGETAFELSKMIRHWTGLLTVITNGASTLSVTQLKQLEALGIEVNEKQVDCLIHHQGHVRSVLFNDSSDLMVDAIYARPEMKQHNDLAVQLGCVMNDHLIATDDFQRTSVTGVYAAGDNAFMMRSLAASIAAGTKAGAVTDRELIMESFEADLVRSGTWR